MFDIEIRKSAEILYDAYRDNKPVAFGKFPIITEEDGYRVEAAVND